MFCGLDDLKTESDVEQKLVWPILTSPSPRGLSFASAEVLTKASIRRLEIGKGAARKLYFPDYVVLLAGLPVLVIEAKAPAEDPLVGLDEARLYAAEIDALFPTGMNPCAHVISCNGGRLLYGAWDSSTPILDLQFADITLASTHYARLVAMVERKALGPLAAKLRHGAGPKERVRPIASLGGQSIRNEQLGHNTFGSTLSLEYGHIFNPVTRSERAYVVNNAYISSKRRERYVEPIDRLIRGVVAPAVHSIETLEDTGKPKEIAAVFSENLKRLESKLVLLVGSVGSGKSTFIDYLTEVALPTDVLGRTLWLRINLNNAPPHREVAHEWIAEQVISGLRESRPDVDFDEISSIRKVYAPELRAFTKGALALLREGTDEYQRRLADKVIELQKDRLQTAKALARYTCGNARKLLVVCLDNCDKRDREEQLLMFQLAQWLQVELRCLIFLPLRDVTYDAHRNEPPLDTAIKNLTFRIEPPRFSDVLARRVGLALNDLVKRAKERSAEYVLPNGMRVEYPLSDQGMYLNTIVRSLYAHDRFVRQIMSGLAGRDIRRALELFLEFCTSGHIGEDQIYRIRALDGQYTIPFDVVARVLLRMNRRFYDGDKSYVKNLFQCDPSDPFPDHFVRLSVLRWLECRANDAGPSGLVGFHRVGSLVSDLVQAGHDMDCVRRECRYLLKERCVVAEHQRTDDLVDDDLVCLSPAGSVHLTLAVVPDYLAACIEDTWLADRPLGQVVAERIGQGGVRQHYSRRTTRQNAKAMFDYLSANLTDYTHRFVNMKSDPAAVDYVRLEEIRRGMLAPRTTHGRIFVGNVPVNSDAEAIVGFFRSHGFLVSELAMLTDEKTSRFSGSVFLTLPNLVDATRAVDELDGALFGGRQLRLDHAEELPSRGRRSERSGAAVDPRRLVLLNLPYDCTIDQIRALLNTESLRHTDIYLPRGSGGKGSGTAFVEFVDETETRRALAALSGLSLQGRTIRAAPAYPRPGGPNHGRQGRQEKVM